MKLNHQGRNYPPNAFTSFKKEQNDDALRSQSYKNFKSTNNLIKNSSQKRRNTQKTKTPPASQNQASSYHTNSESIKKKTVIKVEEI